MPAVHHLASATRPAVLAALLLSIAPPSTADAQAQAQWEASLHGSYALSGPFDGFGAAVSGLWCPSSFLGLGGVVDVTSVSARGETAANGLPYRHSFTSTFVGALIQARLPIGPMLPYADLALGYVDVGATHVENTQCAYAPGVDASLGLGLKVLVDRDFALGARAAARLPGAGLSCSDALGPWSFELAPLISLGATVDFRW